MVGAMLAKKNRYLCYACFAKLCYLYMACQAVVRIMVNTLNEIAVEVLEKPAKLRSNSGNFCDSLASKFTKVVDYIDKFEISDTLATIC